MAFLVGILSLGLVGYFAYTGLTKLVSAIHAQAEPDEKLIQIKEILVDLAAAESSAKAYAITSDSEYLAPFYESLSTIDVKLDILQNYSTNNQLQQQWMDSIGFLIENKFIILYELIESTEDESRENVLNRVLQDIATIEAAQKQYLARRITQIDPIAKPTLDSVNIQIDSIQISTIEPPKNKKSNIFQKIFGKKNREEPQEEQEGNDAAEEEILTVSKLEVPKVVESRPQQRPQEESLAELTEEIQQAVERIKSEELYTLNTLAERELELFQQDRVVMGQIRSYVAKFEDQEAKLSLARAAAARASSESTTNTIIGVSAVLFVLFAGLLVVVFRDITLANRNKQKLQKAKNYAERLAKVKEDFLSNMSHEIRTPMNAIVGFTEQLKVMDLNNKQQGYLDAISTSSSHLLDIINDVLDYSKLEAGNVHIEKIGFKLEECLKAVHTTLEPSALQKGLTLRYSLDEKVPKILLGDPLRLKQILINLVGNAIKFTDTGRVEIFAKSKRLKEGRVLVEISVQDTGIGISAEKLKRIFGSFNQEDNSTTRKYGGTGLGLAISKKLVYLQQGTINAFSKKGEGSLFMFSIPYDVGTISDIKPEFSEEVIDISELRGKKVLIADDEEYNLLLLKTILKKWQVQVATATNGKEAVEELSKNFYHVVFMDLQMPEMDGLEATEVIRNNLKSHVPIIALTAAAARDEKDACKAAGMDDFLVKPVSEDKLYKYLLKALHNQPSHFDILEKEPKKQKVLPTVQPEFDDKPFDLNELAKLTSGDEGFAINMIELFIKNTRTNLKEMLEAMKKEDWATVSMKAHKIAPPSRHLGLMQLVNKLKEIETKAQKKQDIKNLKSLIKKTEKEAVSIIALLQEEVHKLEKKIGVPVS